MTFSAALAEGSEPALVTNDAMLSLSCAFKKLRGGRIGLGVGLVETDGEGVGDTAVAEDDADDAEVLREGVAPAPLIL